MCKVRMREKTGYSRISIWLRKDRYYAISNMNYETMIKCNTLIKSNSWAKWSLFERWHKTKNNLWTKLERFTFYVPRKNDPTKNRRITTDWILNYLRKNTWNTFIKWKVEKDNYMIWWKIIELKNYKRNWKVPKGQIEDYLKKCNDQNLINERNGNPARFSIEYIFIEKPTEESIKPFNSSDWFKNKILNKYTNYIKCPNRKIYYYNKSWELIEY